MPNEDVDRWTGDLLIFIGKLHDLCRAVRTRSPVEPGAVGEAIKLWAVLRAWYGEAVINAVWCESWPLQFKRLPAGFYYDTVSVTLACLRQLAGMRPSSWRLADEDAAA